MWERYNVSAQQAQSQGRSAEAENFHRMALSEAEKVAHNDPKVVMSLNGLANCLRQQGRYSEAEPLYKRAIDIKEKTVGVFPRRSCLSARQLCENAATEWSKCRSR